MASRPDAQSRQGQEEAKRELPSTTANLLRGIGILFALIALALFLSKIAMGAVFLHRCSVEPMLPVLLMVAGVTPLVFPILALCPSHPKQEGRHRLCSLVARALLGIVFLFYLCWLLTNAVYVFRARSFVNERSCNCSHSCVAALPLDIVPGTAVLSTGTTTATSITTAGTNTNTSGLFSPTGTSSNSSSSSSNTSTSKAAPSGQTAVPPADPCLTCPKAFWDFCYAMAVLDLVLLVSVAATLLVAACLSFGTVCMANLLCEGR